MRQSVAFTAMGDMGARLVSLLGFIVLARILSPHEFGLMAMVGVFSAFAAIFLDMGMGSALIHNQQAGDRHYATVFWTNLLMGLLSCALLLLGATAIGGFFNAVELTSVIRVCSAVLILNALAIVPFALLQKHRRFKHVAMVELVSLVCGIGLAIVLARQGYGVWALVANLLAAAFIRMVLSFVLSGWRPSWSFGRNELAEIWRFSGYLMGSGIVNYAARNVDHVLIGKMLSTQALGAYKYAYQIASLPTAIVQSIFGRVFFASYASFQEDRSRIKATHLKAMRVVAFFTVPAMLGLSIIADHFVLTVLGQKWAQMGMVLSFLAIILLISTVAVLNNSLYMSQGATKLQFRLTLVLRGNVILGIVIGIQYGLEGLLWGLLVARIINLYPGFFFAGRLVGIRMSEFGRNVGGVVASGLLMVAVLAALQEGMDLRAGSVAALGILVAAGAAIYGATSFLFQRRLCREVMASLKLRPGVGQAV